MGYKVKLEVVRPVDHEGEDSIAVFVNGEPLFKGYFGGEPEDNNSLRDYFWVESGIIALAKSLGADVAVETIEDDIEG